MSKKITAIVFILIMLAALPLKAFAMTEVSVELPFVVENNKGTVVIEAVDDAPLPEVTEFKDIAEGVFALSYTQPDTYRYRVYQLITDNTSDVVYDKTVYNVVVSVLSDDDGTLHTVYTISIDGDAEKQDAIAFENYEPADNTFTQEPNPQTGDNSNLGLWLVISLVSLAGIIILLFAKRRKGND